MVYTPRSHASSYGDLGDREVSQSTGWPEPLTYFSPVHAPQFGKQVLFSGVELGNEEQCRLATSALFPNSGNMGPYDKPTFIMIM